MNLKELVTGVSGEKQFLLGNEAAVRGVIEAGVSVAAHYPGTPSSEIGNILSFLAKDANLYFEFSTNEKVAMEVAATAAVSGLRSFTFMKHVGLNVASDSFMTTAYSGVKGGMVILVADDPSLFSSQNEQDTRNYARLANLPILEPSNCQEVKDMVKYAFDLSEQFSLPVIVRTTTRVSHMRGIVEFGDKIDNSSDGETHWKKGFFEKNPGQFVPVPANSLRLHVDLCAKMADIKKITNESDLNLVFESGKKGIKKLGNAYNHVKELINLDETKISSDSKKTLKELHDKIDNIKEVAGDSHIGTMLKSGKKGIITSGSAYNYVSDIVNEFNLNVKILKLGFAYPFPSETVANFLKSVDEVFIVEEVDPIMEKEVLAVMGQKGISIPLHGKLDGTFPEYHEFNPDIVKIGLNKVLNFTEIEEVKYSYNLNKLIESIPIRAPVLCSGCPHRSMFYGVNRAVEELNIPIKDVVFASDIGCYTLGLNPPYNAADYLLSMGSSIGDGGGFSKSTNQKVVSFIGDSTFFHSGISPLINGVHNKDNFVVTVLDNRITAMTGGQPNPGIPVDGMGDEAPEISIRKLAVAAGCSFVKVINPLNIEQVIKTYKEALEYDGVAVIISKSPCTLIKGFSKKPAVEFVESKCNNCDKCINELSCPALSKVNGKITVNKSMCTGCSVCVQVCNYDALKPGE